MTTAAQRRAATSSFRTHIDGLRAPSGVHVPPPPMTPAELAEHLQSRSRGGRHRDKHAAARAGGGKGGRGAARRRACRDW